MMTIEKIANKVSKCRGSELDKAIYLNAWIYGSLALSVKDRADDSIEQTLKHMNGSCGHRDNLFREVATLLGWESRRVGFHDVPVQLAHVGTEIFIDGSWHFFDPTFGIYLATEDSPKDALAIEEARKLYPNIKAFASSQKPYAGKSIRKTSQVHTALNDDILIHPFGDWPLASVDGTYFLSKLILESSGHHYVSEITIPIQENDELSFDETALEKGHLCFDYGNTYVGYAQILGKYWGRGPVVSKRILFLTSKQLRVRISMQLRHVPMHNVYAKIHHTVSNYELEASHIKKSIEDRTITWDFVISPPMTTCKISVSYNDSAVIEMLKITAVSI